MRNLIIKGIGIDIEDVQRFHKLPYRRNKSFYSKVFTNGEIRYCLSKRDPYPNFAARFAAKEAAIKALGKNISMKKIEIVNKKSGQPFVRIKDPRLPGGQGFGWQERSRIKILVSLTHTQDHAIAIALRLY